ncbi:MAG: hypothetical protein J6X86_07165 [Bacteroidales bacterium]|nr:hypothetical protein [Bacteroidales bacterium]
MKKILTSLMGLMFMASLVGCDNDEPSNDVTLERDIYYSINEGSAASGFSSTTAHINTESEFDALLDRFCNYAQGGAQVMFCSSRTSSKASSTSTGTGTSINTTNREELKAWMKEMEKAGKTVHVTYDNDSGTWYGRAYANLGQDDVQATQTFNGSLVFVPTPVLEEPPLGGLVWAMQVNTDSILIITLHGMMMWNDSISEDMSIIQGAAMTLEGVAGTHTDLQGNPFMTLSLNIEDEM